MTDKSIQSTVEQRDQHYGGFTDLAGLSQELKNAVRRHKAWGSKSPVVQEAVEMILHKVARIINSNHPQQDSWHDVAGYAHLVEVRLKP